MSMEKAKAFIDKMKSDPAFRERVVAIPDVKARIAFINKEGFECTGDELNELQTQFKSEAGVKGLCASLCHPDHCWC
jgi:predicted ribosomally synthesized peptide with nif11-like leader